MAHLHMLWFEHWLHMVCHGWQCAFELVIEQQHSDQHVHAHVSKDCTEGCIIHATYLLTELTQANQ